MNLRRFLLVVLFLSGSLLTASCITINQYPSLAPTKAPAPVTTPASPTPTLAPVQVPTPARGQTESAATELASIQAAVFSMMVDNNLASLNITRDATNATSNMTSFPGGVVKLYANNMTGTAINYVASPTTKGTYGVDTLGTVTQVSFIPPSAAATELASIQAAVFSMMVDNNLSRLNVTRDASNATANMSIFPNSTYRLYGYILMGSSVNYVANPTTKGTYAVDALGTVTQITTGY